MAKPPKRLILVNPPFGGLLSGFLGRVAKFGYPPVFSVLEAMTPKGYEVVAYNQPFFVRYRPCLAAITCFSSNAHRAYRYADKFRKAGAKVVMGGPHVMFRVEEALEHCDSVVVGEAEPVWPEILKDYSAGELKRVYEGRAEEGFWRRYHEGFLKLPSSKLYIAIQTTRGCKFSCKFCMIPRLFPGAVRHVPVSKVVEQIQAVRGMRRRFLILNDNNVFSDPAYAKELFRALIPLRIRWQALCSADIGKDPEALRLAAASGCSMLHIGFETVNRAAAEANPGKLGMLGDYLALIRAIKSAGIRIKGSFLIGFDEDSYASLWRLFLFTLRANLALSVFSALTPFPGTKLFDDFAASGRLASFDWRKFDVLHVVIEPKQMGRRGFTVLFQLLRFSFLVTTNSGRALWVLLLLAAAFLAARAMGAR